MSLGALRVLTHSISVHQEYLHSCKVWKSNGGKPAGDDKFSFPGSNTGKRSQVLPGEETSLWLSQPLPNCSSKCPSWGPPNSLGRSTGYSGPKLFQQPDPAALALQALQREG